MTISVVIPVKNRPELILQAIESCMRQSLLPDEIIIVDDGSTDTTVRVIMDAAKTNPRIRLICREESGGAAVARNIGAAAATGRYIAFLDSDDRWAEDKLRLQKMLMDADDECVLVGCGVVYEYENRKSRVSLPKEKIIFEDLAISNVLGSTSVGMVRTSVFKELGGFDETLPNCEDWDLWVRFSLCGVVKNVCQPLLYYTYVAQNKLSRDTEKLYRGHRMVFAKIRASTQARHISKLDEIAAFHYLKEAEIRIRIGDGALKALDCIVKAIKQEGGLAVYKRVLKLTALFFVAWGRS